MDSIWASLSTFAPYVGSILLLLVFLEQISYLRKKRFLPGPAFIWPFIENVVSLVRYPTRYWEVQSELAQTSPLGISTNYLIGKFVIFIRSSELSHRVFANVRPDWLIEEEEVKVEEPRTISDWFLL